jgi:hypothetical protein
MKILASGFDGFETEAQDPNMQTGVTGSSSRMSDGTG